MVFGRNYDWIADAGMICTNQRGLTKTSMKASDGNAITWTSKYGSISFNQYGKEFPTGGMNEKGLVVELMWLDGTKYPTPDDRPAIGVLQWIQYQLDNSATVKEVIETDKVLRITSRGTPLHYLIADAGGNSATIEFLDGKMVVHQGSDLPLPVLTNDTYELSLAANIAGTGNNNSLERFSTACSMLTSFKNGGKKENAVDYSFQILQNVAQGDFTKWSIVYDLKNRKIFFRTEKFADIKNLDFSDLSFDCTVTSKHADMNAPGSGPWSEKMVDFSAELNKKITELCFVQSASRISITEAEKTAIFAYPAQTHCSQ